MPWKATRPLTFTPGTGVVGGRLPEKAMGWACSGPDHRRPHAVHRLVAEQGAHDLEVIRLGEEAELVGEVVLPGVAGLHRMRGQDGQELLDPRVSP